MCSLPATSLQFRPNKNGVPITNNRLTLGPGKKYGFTAFGPLFVADGRVFKCDIVINVVHKYIGVGVMSESKAEQNWQLHDWCRKGDGIHLIYNDSDFQSNTGHSNDLRFVLGDTLRIQLDMERRRIDISSCQGRGTAYMDQLPPKCYFGVVLKADKVTVRQPRFEGNISAAPPLKAIASNIALEETKMDEGSQLQSKIYVKTMDGQILTFHLNLKQTTLNALKIMISKKANIPIGQQRIAFNGMPLSEENLMLSQCGVKNESTLHLVDEDALEEKKEEMAAMDEPIHKTAKVDFNSNAGNAVKAAINRVDNAMIDTDTGASAVADTENITIDFALDMDKDTFESQQNAFKKDLAESLGVDPSDIVLMMVTKGSTIIKAMITNIVKSFSGTAVVDAGESSKSDVAKIKKKLQSVKKAVKDFCSSPKGTKWKPKSEPKVSGGTKPNGSGGQWLAEQSSKLRQLVNSGLEKCPIKWKIDAVIVLNNNSLLNNFCAHSDYKKAKLLFHGTREDRIDAIMGEGFLKKAGKTLDAGYYGAGHYFTSYPQYAMHYARGYTTALTVQKDDRWTLLGCYANLGNTAEVNQLRMGAAMPNGCQSSHVWVCGDSNGGQFGYPVTGQHKGSVFDEWVIPEPSRILPQYAFLLSANIEAKKPRFIWRDPKVGNSENDSVFQKIRKECNNIYTALSTNEALDLLKKNSDFPLFVITNGGNNGEGFVKSVRNDLKLDCPIIVFCGAVAWHSQWAAQYDDVKVTGSSTEVHDFIQKHNVFE